MPFDPSVTFADAEKARSQKLSIAKSRQAPPMLDLIQDAARQKTFRIFNVGPWPQRINSGSYGWYEVPGCPTDQEYVYCHRAIAGIEFETIIKDEARLDNLYSDGKNFAIALLGEGRNQNPARSLRHDGLFVSEGDTPTREELEQARLMLHAKCSEIVAEARNLFAQDRKSFATIVKPAKHFAAARVLNLMDEPWMTEQKPSTRNKCRYCATMNDEEAVICSKCSKPINIAKYKAMLAEDEAQLEEPKRGPGRPKKTEPTE